MKDHYEVDRTLGGMTPGVREEDVDDNREWLDALDKFPELQVDDELHKAIREEVENKISFKKVSN